MTIIHYREDNGDYKTVGAYKKGFYWYDIKTNKKIENINIYWRE